jgi:hypothetical protein
MLTLVANPLISLVIMLYVIAGQSIFEHALLPQMIENAYAGDHAALVTLADIHADGPRAILITLSVILLWPLLVIAGFIRAKAS